MRRIDKAAWKLRRAMAMSPGEVGLRVARGVRHRVARPRRPRPQEEIVALERVVGVATDPADALGRARESLESSRFSLLPGARDSGALRRGLEAIGVDPIDVERSGEAVLAGRIPGFGWAAFELGSAPDWHADPVSGERWDLDFWADIDLYGGSRPAEPRFTWEVNRHHHLVTLGRAYALTGDPRFARAVWGQIGSWIDSNPPLFGINWSSALEIGLRLISWAMAVDLIGVDCAQEGDVRRLAVSAALQARHVHDNLTIYASSKNNHLIGEAAGLAVAGAKFAFLAESGPWSELGLDLVEREVPAQVETDGVSREQTFHYGAFVLELCLAALAAARALGRAPSPALDEVVEKMADFLVSVGGPGGVPPSIGDGDGGRVIELSDQEIGRQPIRASLAAGVAAGRRAVPSLSPRDLEAAVWLSGPAAVSGWLDAGNRAGRGRSPLGPARAYEQGGYFVAGGGDHHGVVDCGPLGYLSTAAHGHADCLSVVVAHRGHWVVVDPGTCCYHGNPVLRDHFRSTQAHNTVTVDRESQSEMLGAFLWGRRATPSPRAWAVNPRWQYFEGEHDGYAWRGVTHRRSVVYVTGGYWVILDVMLGTGRHEVAATFQLAEGMVERDGASGVFADGDGRSVRIASWLPDGFGLKVVEGREDPPAGWISPGFGLRRPAPALVVSGKPVLPAAMAFAVVPFEGEAEIELSCPSGPLVSGTEIVAGLSGGSDRLIFGDGVGDGVFAGVFGFVASRGGEEVASGLGVRRWATSDADVGFTPVENLLRGKTERSRSRA